MEQEIRTSLEDQVQALLDSRDLVEASLVKVVAIQDDLDDACSTLKQVSLVSARDAAVSKSMIDEAYMEMYDLLHSIDQQLAEREQ